MFIPKLFQKIYKHPPQVILFLKTKIKIISIEFGFFQKLNISENDWIELLEVKLNNVSIRMISDHFN